jgi:ketosteroid isomerase-like protein
MRTWLAALGLVACFCLLAFGRPSVSSSSGMTDSDFRKLEQKWLDAAAVPDLPELRKMFADDFMGTAFGTKVLTKSDVIPPEGETANHLPKSVLQDSAVRIYGDTAVLMGGVSEAGKSTGGLRVTTVFQKRGGDWQIIAVRMSAAPQEHEQ